MSKPKIGISGSVLVDQGGSFAGYHRAYVNDDYVQAVVRANGIPYMLPVHTSFAMIEEQIQMLDGLILSGGHDIDPIFYGEEPHHLLQEIFHDRDQFDLKLLEIAKKYHIPVLGICRGFQLINVFHQGTLYQDATLKEGSYIKHNQVSNPNQVIHTIDVEKGTQLHQILGDRYRVNSFHHLVIHHVGEGLQISARAKDGVVEGLESNDGNIIAVQFHPEMLAKEDNRMQALFDHLIEKAKGEKHE